MSSDNSIKHLKNKRFSGRFLINVMFDH